MEAGVIRPDFEIIASLTRGEGVVLTFPKLLEVSEVRDIGRGGEWRSEEYRKVGKCATTIDNINKLCVFDAKETGLFWSNVVCSDRQVDQAFGISGEEGPGRVFEEEVTQDEGGKGATFDEVPYSDL